MVSLSLYITQGARVFFTSWKNRLFTKSKYSGNSVEICEEIVKDCWNDKFFQTSSQNFPQFWSRDFGWCVNSLIKLKYKKEVHKTLRYALNIFQQHGSVTTTITPRGKAFDFPKMAVDSLPWLIHAIVVSKFEYDTYAEFLNQEIIKYHKEIVDKKTKLVRSDIDYSSIKDFSIRHSSCYDNCMVGMLATDLCELSLDNPFIDAPKKIKRQEKKELVQKAYSKLLIKHFFNGEYFYDDLQKKPFVAGDAQLFPIWCGFIHNEEIILQVMKKVSENELDTPFPLKYSQRTTLVDFIPQEFFFKDYESDSVWTHMGLLWIDVISKLAPKSAKEQLGAYTRMIEEETGFCEVLFPSGKPFNTPFYYCDKTMLWAANYLQLRKKMENIE